MPVTCIRYSQKFMSKTRVIYTQWHWIMHNKLFVHLESLSYTIPYVCPSSIHCPFNVSVVIMFHIFYNYVWIRHVFFYGQIVQTKTSLDDTHSSFWGTMKIMQASEKQAVKLNQSIRYTKSQFWNWLFLVGNMVCLEKSDI